MVKYSILFEVWTEFLSIFGWPLAWKGYWEEGYENKRRQGLRETDVDLP
jgi:hypothetical protein